LEFAEDIYRNLIESSPYPMYFLSGAEFVISVVNPATLKAWGKDASIRGMRFRDALPELADQPFESLLKEVYRSGITYHTNNDPAQLLVNGIMQTFYFEFTFQAMRDTQGSIVGVMAYATDVTAQIKTNLLNTELKTRIEARVGELAGTTEELQAINEELGASNEELAAVNEELAVTNEELKETQQYLEQTLKNLAASEAQLRNFVASSPFPIGVYIGREMKIMLANQNILDVWGKGNDVVGMLYSDILPELTNQQIFEQLDAVFTTGISFHAFNQRIDLIIDGELKTYYFNYSFTPLLNAHGEVYGVMNTAADVTDLNIAKQQVDQNAHNLQNMILQAPVAMCILLGPEHVISVANKLMIELWGKEASAVLNKPVFEALPDARGQGLEAVMDKVYQKGETFSANEMPVALLRNGREEIVYQNFVYEPYRDTDGTILGIIAITIDITAQVRAKDELGETIAHLNLVNKQLADTSDVLNMAIDAANLGIWNTNLITDELTITDIAKQIHGIPPTQKMTLTAAFDLIVPEDRQRIVSAIQSSIEQNTSFNEEYMIQPMDGNAPRWLASSGKAYFDDKGNPVSIVGTLLDITEQKHDEQRKNDFIGMVSHELKTPITSMKGYVQVLLRSAEKQKDSLAVSLLEKANVQVNKMTSMINSFLNVSRLESGKIHIALEAFDFSKLIQDTKEEFRATITSHLFHFEDVPPVVVQADREKIGQVINNLISNAIKYSPSGSTISIKCIVQNGSIEVSVTDQGMGIKQEDIAKVFERYFRVEGAQMFSISGFGIGLYLSAEIIHRHHGKIWVESEFGRGSTFYFKLPFKNKSVR